MTAPRHAPAFEIRLRPDPGLGLFSSVIGAASGAALVAAVAKQVNLAPGAWLLATGLLAPAMAWLGWRLTQHVPQALRWDGQGWWLDETPQRLAVVMDLGGWLLLRLCARTGWALPRYRALSRAQCGPQWSSLRATLYSANQLPRARS